MKLEKQFIAISINLSSSLETCKAQNQIPELYNLRLTAYGVQ